MFFKFAKRWWPSRSVRRSPRRSRPIRLSLERLEDRLVPTAFEPWQIQQAYGFNEISFNNGAIPGDGTGQTIAIVDAYNDPNITQDVNTFDRQFGLTSANSPTLYQNYGDASLFLSVVNQTGGSTLPVDNSSWSQETSLDVQWAHAIAPGAKIVLVEANSNSSNDLYSAAKYAGSIPGVSVVSMSFGGSFSGESASDPDFSHAGVTYVASAGDDGLFTYPGASANVLAVGGTSLTLDASGNYVRETVWNDRGDGGSEPAWITSGSGTVLTNPPPASWGESGGGPSPYDTHKIGPDVGYNADPDTGYYVYDSYGASGWLVEGGTSEGAPQWAALIALADQGRAANGLGSLSGGQTLKMIRNANMENFDFHHAISGSIEYTLNGVQHTYSGRSVYGQGTPIANVLVQDLVYGTAPATPTGLTATAVSSSAIDLSWNSGTDAHSYTLEWSTNGTTWKVLAKTSGTTYADTGLTAGTKYYYRILASNGLGSSAYSLAVNATPTAASPPVVTTNPSNDTVAGGSTATFTAAASGSPTPSVQWEVSTDGGSTWTDISGATSTTLTLTSVTGTMSGYEYRAVFTNTSGSASTSAAKLTVTPGTLTVSAATVADLIADIHAANDDPSDHYILDLTSSLYDLTAVNNYSNGANGLPVITGDITIEGNGATIQRDTSAAAFRLLQVNSGASLTLDDLWLKNGLALGLDSYPSANAAFGGAIFTSGTLNLNNTVVELNKAEGSNSAFSVTWGVKGSGRYGATGYGGGLYVAGGSVSVTDSVLYVNTAQGGNGGAPLAGGFGGTGGDAFGGGIFVAGGSVTLNNDTLQGNRALGGNGGVGAGEGGAALGGAVYVEGGTLNLGNDYVAVNYALGGNGGNGTGGPGGGGSAGSGSGGGLAMEGGTATLTNDYLIENDAQGGKGGIVILGSWVGGGTGGDGYGGDVEVYGNGSLTLTNDTLYGSAAFGGQGGNGSGGASGGNGGSGYGGGLLVSGGTLTLTNDTLNHLYVFGGNGGNGGNPTAGVGGNGGNGGNATGGALLVQGGTVTLLNDTVSDHDAESGSGGNGGSGTTQGNGGNGGNATGGGIALTGGTTDLTNTIVANGAFWAAPGGSGATYGSRGIGSDADISGNVASSDRDLIGDGTGGNLVNGVNGNQVGTSASPINPLLGPLQNNGGPLAGAPNLFGGQQGIPTLALLAGSPAINAGDNNATPGSTDQRGYARIAGGTIDIGAYESQADVSTAVSVVQGNIVYNSTLQEYVQTVTLTNVGSSALLGPLALQLNNLSGNATLANPSGTDNGNPYVDFVSPGGQLAAGQSITVTLYFKDPTNQSISYDTQVWQNL